MERAQCLLILVMFGVLSVTCNPITLSMAETYKDDVNKPTIEEQMEVAMFAANQGPAQHPGIGNQDTRIELDILLTKEQADEILNAKRKKRNAIKDEFSRWPDATIPYELDESHFDADDKQTILDSMKAWEDATCLKFTEKASDATEYVSVKEGDGGCYSYVGRIGRPQDLGLGNGCVFKEVVVHEFGHALGLFHHQGRPDRDDFVEIVYDNIYDGLEDQFEKHASTSVSLFDVLYDYRSVMHYGRRFFSKNGQDTIRTKDPAYIDVIGRAPSLSFRDAKIVNAMYSCAQNAGCDDTPCPGEGYKGEDCLCYCPDNDGADIVRCSEPATTTEKPTTTTAATTTTTASTAQSSTPEESTITTTTTTIPTTTTTKQSSSTTQSVPSTSIVDISSSTFYPSASTVESSSATNFPSSTAIDGSDTTPFDSFTTEVPCFNEWPNKRCRKLSRDDKCSRRKVRKNCELACGNCGDRFVQDTCTDKFGEHLCMGLSWLCEDWTFIQKKCKLTCGMC